jgi:hypothetical protein
VFRAYGVACESYTRAMLHLLRVCFLVVIAGILVDAVIRIGTGTTGTVEKSVVLIVGCLWILAVWRELRALGRGPLLRKAH